MSDKLTWMHHAVRFMGKEFRAPFILQKDEEYYPALRKIYANLKQSLIEAQADQESIDIVSATSDRITDAVNAYLHGDVVRAQIAIRNIVKQCDRDPFAVTTLGNCHAFHGAIAETQFFKARTGDQVDGYSPSQMLHIPFTDRGKTGSERFSIPGLPCLYLANSSYGCWIELGKPPEYKFNVSPFVLSDDIKVLDLAVMTRLQLFLNQGEPARVHGWLRRIVLMIATSFRIQEKERKFKSEYIVSQSIMLACQVLGIDGVVYYSKRVEKEDFAFAATNIALIAKYNATKKYSDICNHIKVDDSYNFMVYKQLRKSEIDLNYELKLDKTGITNNISFKDYSRQFDYRQTEFYLFDKFLFANWKNKENISFGHAIEGDK